MNTKTSEHEIYQLFFTDMLNQRIIGGAYLSFSLALLTGRGIVANGFRSSFQVVRTSDGIVLAQSKH